MRGSPAEKMSAASAIRKRHVKKQDISSIREEKTSQPVSEHGEYQDVGGITRLFDSITFGWMSPLMGKLGSLPPTLPDPSLTGANKNMEKLSEDFDKAFCRHVAKATRYPLARTLWEILWSDIWISGFCQLMNSIFQLLVPFLTKYLIACAVEAHKAPDRRNLSVHSMRGLAFVVGIACAQISQTLFASQFLFRGQRLSCQTRAVLMNQTLSKLLRLSNRPSADVEVESIDEEKSKEMTDSATLDKGWSNRRLYTLITSEITRVQNAWEMVHYIWTAPISIGVASLTLKANIGNSAIWGSTIVVLGIIVITVAMDVVAESKRTITKLTDERASMTNEMSHSIQLLKLFGWESKFMERFRFFREKETQKIQEAHRILTWIRTLWALLPTFATMGSLIAYSMSADEFDPMSIFTTLATFNALRPLLNMLPHVIGQVTTALDASSHVESFLLEEEPDNYIQNAPFGSYAIRLECATLSWGKNSEISHNTQGDVHQKDLSRAQRPPFVLRNLALNIRSNEMLAVIGLTASGKSSFLEGLAGNMTLVEGTVYTSGTTAFCPQYAWMKNASIRENILFGREYNAARYNEVIESCALKADLEQLTNGDESQVGDRGAALSGGQKARISIARAIYSQADIILMDDPFASVDSNVGQHIMEHVLCGLLKDRCRVVATHNPSILNRCDRILIMDEGRISETGTFDELVQRGALGNALPPRTDDDLVAPRSQEPTYHDEKRPLERQARNPEVNSRDKLVPPKEISLNGWKTYLAAGGSYLNCAVIVLLTVLGNAMGLVSSSWLSYWTSGKSSTFSNTQSASIYAVLSISQSILLAYSTTYLMARGITASKLLFHQATNRVIRAPISLFESGFLGVVLRQMATDTNRLDMHLTNYIRLFSMKAVTTSGVIAITIYHSRYFLLVVGPLLHIFLHVVRRYKVVAANLNRLKLKRRSVLYARLSETMAGMGCIRNYDAWDYFRKDIQDHIYAWNEIHLLSSACPRWLTIRLDAVGIAISSLVGAMSVVPWFGISPSVCGMLITNVLSISQTLPLALRNMHDMMNALRVVEGIVYYNNNIPQEGSILPSGPSALESDRKSCPPSTGRIRFINASMRYRPELPLVLEEINLDIRDREKIALVGRTGAGKSSIVSALLRMTDLYDGSIEIDGTDISSIRLDHLRSAIAVIPQGVTLFAGSIRSNVDPFHEYEDADIYSALKKVSFVNGLEMICNEKNSSVSDSLKSIMDKVLRLPVKEGGANISLGNQQKIAIARVLLRDARIVVCDEATSGVDLEMDEHIQQTIDEVFSQKTILYITHRVHSAFRCDRVCVMGQGRVQEIGSPSQLWNHVDGMFRAMCDRSGITEKNVHE